MKKGTSQPVGLPKGLDEKVILERLKHLNVGKVGLVFTSRQSSSSGAKASTKRS